MARGNLKMFTNISFYIALFTTIVFPISLFLSLSISNENVQSMLGGAIFITSLTSLFALPLSIVSMFSKENLAKRIFTLIANFTPVGIIAYGITIELINGFFQTPT